MQNDDHSNQDEEVARSTSLSGLLNKAKFLLISVCGISIVVIALEATGLGRRLGYDLSKIGAWGDTVGGFLNPIFGFAALIGLLHTIELQLNELELTREQVEKSADELKGSRLANQALVSAAEQQNIENSFFQLFNYFTTMVERMQFTGFFRSASIKTRVGTRGFESVGEDFRSRIKGYLDEAEPSTIFHGDPDEWPPNGMSQLLKLHGDEDNVASYAANAFYEPIYLEQQAELGKYYRVLYNILRFLDTKKDELPATMVETYTKLFRACLSNYELFLIVLNCNTGPGKPMIKYVNKFSLLDNLPVSFFSVPYHDYHGNRLGELDIRTLTDVFEDRAFGDQVELFRRGRQV